MTTRAEPALALYRFTATAFGPLAPAMLAWRRGRGKEDGARLGERLGRPSLARPKGRLAWLHGASVGESLSLLPLIERLIARGLPVLVTTGTVSSARILAQRLPPGARHQFAPLDVPGFLRRFLDHWRPDIALIAESELWPNALCAIKARGVPLMLVNARLSRRSFRRWRVLPRTIASLLERIDLILAQTREDGVRLERLGAPRVQIAGNLKYDVPAPPVDPARLAELTAAIGARPVWLAASTHPDEEAILIDAHRRLAASEPSLLTIIAPRHADRGAAIATAAATRGVRAARRSHGRAIDAGVALYIADTMGELGLFYRVCGVVFLGKSLGGQGGGQNPIEPAKLGAALLHGPAVTNFAEAYAAIDAAAGALPVADASALSAALAGLFADPARTRRMARAAGETVERLGGATNAVMQAIEPFLMQMQLDRR